MLPIRLSKAKYPFQFQQQFFRSFLLCGREKGLSRSEAIRHENTETTHHGGVLHLSGQGDEPHYMKNERYRGRDHESSSIVGRPERDSPEDGYTPTQCEGSK